MQTKNKFFGLMVNTEGIRIEDDRKKLIENGSNHPISLTLKVFWALYNIFGVSKKIFFRVKAPLTNLSRDNNLISKWNDNCWDAFDSLENALMTAPIMQVPDCSRAFCRNTDSRQFTIEGSLLKLATIETSMLFYIYSRDCLQLKKSIRRMIENCSLLYTFFHNLDAIWRAASLRS